MCKDEKLTSFGERLKLARRQAKLTQKALGKKVGVCTGTICRLETGKANPTFALKLIASTLEVSYEWLLGDSKCRKSLAEKHPKLANEYHPTKNATDAYNVSYGAKVKVWWICSDCKHEWLASPNERTSMGSICPGCAPESFGVKQTIIYSHPILASELHPTKNKSLKIGGPNSKLTVWWLCSECDHEWMDSPFRRMNVPSARTCPACVKRHAETIINDALVSHSGRLLSSKALSLSNYSYNIFCSNSHMFSITTKEILDNKWCGTCGHPKTKLTKYDSFKQVLQSLGYSTRLS